MADESQSGQEDQQTPEQRSRTQQVRQNVSDDEPPTKKRRISRRLQDRRMEREQTTDLMLGHSEQLDVAALLCRLKQPTKKMLSTSRCQPKVMHHGPQQEEEIMTSKTKRTPVSKIELTRRTD